MSILSTSTWKNQCRPSIPWNRIQPSGERPIHDSIMLSERSKPQRHILYGHFYEISRIDKSTGTESKLVVAGGRQDAEGLLNGHQASFWDEENVLEPER